MQPGAPISLDVRKRIIAAWRKGGYTQPQLAAVFGVGVATIVRLIHRYRETGSVAPRARGGGAPRRLTSKDVQKLQTLVERNPDWTTAELAEAMSELLGSKVSRSTVQRELRRLGYTPKKSRSSPRSATRTASASGAASTTKSSRRRPLRVLFLWTKPART